MPDRTSFQNQKPGTVGAAVPGSFFGGFVAPDNKLPEHTVFLVTRDLNSLGKRVYTKVGVGWDAFDGVLSIKLNPGVVLDWKITEDFYINVIRNNPDVPLR